MALRRSVLPQNIAAQALAIKTADCATVRLASLAIRFVGASASFSPRCAAMVGVFGCFTLRDLAL
jgi:hypothetical protein